MHAHIYGHTVRKTLCVLLFLHGFIDDVIITCLHLRCHAQDRKQHAMNRRHLASCKDSLQSVGSCYHRCTSLEHGQALLHHFLHKQCQALASPSVGMAMAWHGSEHPTDCLRASFQSCSSITRLPRHQAPGAAFLHSCIYIAMPCSGRPISSKLRCAVRRSCL